MQYIKFTEFWRNLFRSRVMQSRLVTIMPRHAFRRVGMSKPFLEILLIYYYELLWACPTTPTWYEVENESICFLFTCLPIYKKIHFISKLTLEMDFHESGNLTVLGHNTGIKILPDMRFVMKNEELQVTKTNEFFLEYTKHSILGPFCPNMS